VKLFAIFDSMPKHDAAITGEWHYLALAGGAILFVSSPRNYAMAEKHLADLGGHVFPDMLSSETIPDHKTLPALGLTPQHTTYRAARVLGKGWPIADPR
jgi:hypothetical protein